MFVFVSSKHVSIALICIEFRQSSPKRPDTPNQEAFESPFECHPFFPRYSGNSVKNSDFKTIWEYALPMTPHGPHGHEIWGFYHCEKIRTILHQTTAPFIILTKLQWFRTSQTRCILSDWFYCMCRVTTESFGNKTCFMFPNVCIKVSQCQTICTQRHFDAGPNHADISTTVGPCKDGFTKRWREQLPLWLITHAVFGRQCNCHCFGHVVIAFSQPYQSVVVLLIHL